MCIIPTYVFPNYNVQWNAKSSIDVKWKKEDEPLILDFGQVGIRVEKHDNFYYVEIHHNIFYDYITFVLNDEEMKELVRKLVEVV